MKYCSTDLETWRLAPRNPEGIAMMSMVVEDTAHPEVLTAMLPHYTVIVEPQQGVILQGTLTALAMNAWLMIAIEWSKSKMSRDAFRKKYSSLGIPDAVLYRAEKAIFIDKIPVVSWDEAVHGAQVFLSEHFGNKDKITLAGKNVMGFDFHFLGAELQSRFRYSGADPGSMFWDTQNDRQLPGTEQVMQRAGVPYEDGHDAHSDACMVIEAIRRDPKLVMKELLRRAGNCLARYSDADGLGLPSNQEVADLLRTIWSTIDPSRTK